MEGKDKKNKKFAQYLPIGKKPPPPQGKDPNLPRKKEAKEKTVRKSSHRKN